MGAYIVLLVIAGLGIALGWRLAEGPAHERPSDGLARLLQLAVAFTGLAAIALLSVPWLMAVPDLVCSSEAEQAGECIRILDMGVYREAGLFGAAAFMCALGTAFSFVLRKGVLDFPDAASAERREQQAEATDQATAQASAEPATAEPDSADPEPDVDTVETKTKTKTKTKTRPTAEAEAGATAEPDDEGEEAQVDDGDDDRDPDGDEPPGETRTDDGATGEADGDTPAPHRPKLEGPVFQAFIDDEATDLDVAIEAAVERLTEGGKRIAVVFSRGAGAEANRALDEFANAVDAYRYVLEGTGDMAPAGPNAIDDIAGADARHAGELALDLAGTLIESVMLLDTRVAFPAYVLGRLNQVQSVCIAHAHDDVSGACQVVLPGTNPGEKEGELVDSEGRNNLRRPRTWLVERMSSVLRARRGEPEPETPEPETPEPEPAPEPSDDSPPPEVETADTSDSGEGDPPEVETADDDASDSGEGDPPEVETADDDASDSGEGDPPEGETADDDASDSGEGDPPEVETADDDAGDDEEGNAEAEADNSDEDDPPAPADDDEKPEA